MLSLALIPTVVLAASAAASPLQKRSVPIVEQCNVSGQVAITFDDGPYLWDQELMNTFGNDRATFFVNGNNYRCIYDENMVASLKAMDAAGFTIGNHGWSHKDMTTLTWDQMHDELWRVENAMIKILGKKPVYFRPPYGAYNDLLLAALDNRGYKGMILWSDDAKDGDNSSVGSQLAKYDRFVSSFPNPHLMLQHSTKETTVRQTIPQALPKLRAAGYKMVAIDTCLGSQGVWPYTWVGNPGQRDSSWTC